MATGLNILGGDPWFYLPKSNYTYYCKLHTNLYDDTEKKNDIYTVFVNVVNKILFLPSCTVLQFKPKNIFKIKN